MSLLALRGPEPQRLVCIPRLIPKRAWGVQGGVHAFAHLHALKDSCPRTVVKVARQLKPSRSTSSRRVHSAKLVISRGIWRTISENPCQKISKYSPNRTKHKHTKRAKSTATVQPQKVRPPQPIQWTSQTTCNRKALDVTDLSPPATPNVNVPPHPPERRA